MEIFLDCLPCILRQVLEASRLTTEDIQIQEKIMEESIRQLLNYKQFRNSPDIVSSIHQIIKDYTGTMDPYKSVKDIDLAAAQKAYPFLKEFLFDKKDKLYWSLKIAATGNNIDSAIYSNIDLEECIQQELNREFAACDINLFEKKLEKAKEILIIGDNAGETIFDKVMIENFNHLNITYGVRNNPIINDVTIREAYASGLEKVSHVISTGCNAPGTILEDCSDEFMNIYKNADIIISKGQGNYEALSEQKGNIFYLLKAKCPMIAKKLKVTLNDYVFIYSGDK